MRRRNLLRGMATCPHRRDRGKDLEARRGQGGGFSCSFLHPWHPFHEIHCEADQHGASLTQCAVRPQVVEKTEVELGSLFLLGLNFGHKIG